MAKVSVIIPVYNTGPYLVRCLESVCGQTLDEIEIICIDDGSTDGSVSTIRDYAAKDGRINLICMKCNKGVSVARNVGIAAAKGQYLAFMDSDDTVELDFLEALYATAKKTGANLIKGRRWALFNGTSTEQVLNPYIREDKFRFTWQFTTALYERDFILTNGISFPPGVATSEDVAFLMKCIACSPSLELEDKAIYYYHRREDTTNSEALTYTQASAALDACCHVADFLNQREILGEAYRSVYKQCLGLPCSFVSRVIDIDKEKTADRCVETLLLLLHECKDPSLINGRMKLFQRLKHKGDQQTVNELLFTDTPFEIILRKSLRR